MLVALALHAPRAVVADRCRRSAAGGVGAHGRGAALELFDIATRLRGRTVDVRRALGASPADAARSGGGAIAVRRASHAPPRRDITNWLVGPAVAVLIALHAGAGGRIAELRSVIPALRVVRALRAALVVARPTRRRGRPAVRAVPALLATTGQTERIAGSAVRVAETLHAAERRIALASAARALRAREVPAADERAVLSFAPARDDDERREREGNHPVLHGSYGSVRAR